MTECIAIASWVLVIIGVVIFILSLYLSIDFIENKIPPRILDILLLTVSICGMSVGLVSIIHFGICPIISFILQYIPCVVLWWFK